VVAPPVAPPVAATTAPSPRSSPSSPQFIFPTPLAPLDEPTRAPRFEPTPFVPPPRPSPPSPSPSPSRRGLLGAPGPAAAPP
jgi:hypothetical protein